MNVPFVVNPAVAAALKQHVGWVEGRDFVVSEPLPAVVWMVRDLADCPCQCPGEPVALFPTEEAANAFAGRVEHVNRHYIIERWEVPGLE